MDERAVRSAIKRMAGEIVERNGGVTGLILVGIQRRGVQLSQFLADEIEAAHQTKVPLGTLDITLYRDDLTAIGPRPVLGETRLPTGGIDGKVIIIVDDVCYTGRTARAALDELADFGRPARIQLAVLIDRGGRELPIQPDVIGEKLQVSEKEIVEVRVPVIDGVLGVEIVPRNA